MTVIADIGDSLFGEADLEMDRQTEFLSPAYYTSMGFGVPAAVGASMANPAAHPRCCRRRRFQMTGMEISTIARYGLNPIVVVLTTTVTRPSGSSWTAPSMTFRTGPITRSPKSSVRGSGSR